jgi:hypothetical protein
MNIFVLDKNITRCAEYHVDKHVVKMILESTQLLNNALIANDPSYVPVYRQTHKNHPCSLWSSKSRSNFDWLVDLSLALSEEYTYRYSKIHKCTSIIKQFKKSQSRLQIPDVGLTEFAKCMPDPYKVDDPIESYRNYYRTDKAYIAKWSKRNIPVWW